MSNSVDLSVSQLLHVARKKLQDTILGGSTTVNQIEVNGLEQDVLEVLDVVRSIKNTFVPVNRIPPEILSLIPDYCQTGEGFIKLTHPNQSLYRRSKGAPLNISLAAHKDIHYHNDALLLALPFITRLKALSFSGFSDNILKLIKQFSFPAPLLERLDISVSDPRLAVFESPILDGNPSLLRELRLSRVISTLPWRSLSNLTTFHFGNVPSDTITVAQLLVFFEHAPLLRRMELVGSLPESSNASAERVVYLPHLRSLRILSQPAPSILLNHLHVPTGALVTLEFPFGHGTSPIPDYLPTPLDNLSNISHVTSVNFDFGSGISMRLKGPSGCLYVFGTWNDRSPVPCSLGEQTLQSFNKLNISTIEKLSITRYGSLARWEHEKSGAYQTLLLMNNLRTLTLTDSVNLSFAIALTPNENPSNTVVCPELEKYAQYIGDEGPPRIEYLMKMVKGRALRVQSCRLS